MIIHVAPTPFFSDRGCHIRIEGIVHALNTIGLDSEVCTYHHGNDCPNITVFRIAPIRGYTQTEAGPSVYKPWANWKLALLTAKRIRAVKPVALHAHLHEGVLISLLSRLLAFKPSIPIVADMQGSLVGELDTYGFFTKAPFLKFPFSLLERFILSRATKIVCSSNHAFEKFAAEFPSCKDKLTLAQDGAMPPLPPSPTRITELESELKNDKSKTTVIYTGALLNSKGLANLKALLLLCKQDTHALHFIVIGYPTEDLSDFLVENSLQSTCTVLGRVPFSTLQDYLSIADIAIDTKNSSAGEGSGKMLNYLANGLPVVAFNTNNNIGFLGDAALLSNDVYQMREHLLLYASNEDLMKSVADSNQNRFSNKFSWSVAANQLKGVYSSLGLLR